MPQGEQPPDECIELAIWDMFGWMPSETERLTSRQLRILFAILEQRRVSTYIAENFKPDFSRMERQLAGLAAAEEAKQQQVGLPTNQAVLKRELRR